MPFMVRIRTQPRAVAVLMLAVTALVCVGGFASPAMAGSMDQSCFGPACEDQIGCAQPAPPSASSGSSIHLIALPAAVERGLVLAKTDTLVLGPPPLIVARRSFAPVGPRSPPAA